jgi:hypothetical protein
MLATPPRRLTTLLALALAFVVVLVAVTDVESWHGWEWRFWDPLVAIGTLLLAAATGALAWFTYQVTRDSRDEIALERRRLEASQRPIVLPAALQPVTPVSADRRRALVLMNAGPGAALNVVTTLRWRDPTPFTLTLPQVHIRPTGSIDLLIEAAPGKPTPPGLEWLHVDGSIVCNDLAGGTWHTDFLIRAPDVQTPPTLDVQAPRGVESTA